jgi:hypothetical protein
MRSFSLVIWIGLAILGVSGVGLFLLHPSVYIASAGFMAKMVFVAILIVNGLFLNFYTTARLTTFNFSEKYQRKGAAWKARKLSFILGAVSTTSWYAALFAAMFKGLIKLPFLGYIGIYLVVLAGAIITALLLEIKLSSRATPARNTIDTLVENQAAAIRSVPVTPPVITTNNVMPVSEVPAAPTQTGPAPPVQEPGSETPAQA